MKKYFSKIAAIMAVAALFLMTGCTEDTSVNYSDSVIKVVGTLHGVVTDANDNARMEGVTVTVVQKDKIFTTTTDALGYYIVKSLWSGYYEATFTMNGFAVARSTGYIPTEAEVYDSKADINHVEVLDMDLFSLNSGLTGKIYKVIDNGNIVAASGVTVIADFNHFDLSPDQYTATTNASGVYSFSNLPATPMVTVRTLPYNDGTYSFDPILSSAGLIPGVTVTAQDMGLMITEAPVFVLTHNMQDGFLIGGNIVMTFNKAIDPNTFRVYLGQAKTEITSIVWTNSNTTVTINPDEDLILDTTYELWYEGKSIDGNSFGYSHEFDTQSGIEILKTNLEVYDEYYRIANNQAIIIEFTESVNTSATGNMLVIWDSNTWNPYTVTGSWSNNNKTLTIPAPAGNYAVGEIFIQIRYFSSLAEYDNVAFNKYVEIK
jgi:hypothetical protein